VLHSAGAQRHRQQLVVAVPISDEEVIVGAIRTSMSCSVVDDRTIAPGPPWPP